MRALLSPYIMGGVLIAALALGSYVWALRADNAALASENASLARSVVVLEDARAQARLAAEVARASADRERAGNAKASAVIERLSTTDFGECADETLDPALRDILDGL